MQSIIQKLAIAVLAFIGVYWLTVQYERALGDTLFIDGWVLISAMVLQLMLHIKKKTPSLLFASEPTWRQVHIYAGYFVVLMFVLHTGVSLPDTGFEWVLGGLFVLVVLSGMLGTYLTTAIPVRLDHINNRVEADQLLIVREDLERRASGLALEAVGVSGSPAISDFYVGTLHNFFNAPRNLLSHLRTSRRPLKRLFFELDNLEYQLGENSAGHAMVAELKNLVEAKNQIDFQIAHERVLKAWLFVHVPATYGLIVLTVIHVAVVYAYRSGV